MNESFNSLITSMGHSCVPFIAHYENLYQLIKANYEWMVGGYGEGIVKSGL